MMMIIDRFEGDLAVISMYDEATGEVFFKNLPADWLPEDAAEVLVDVDEYVDPIEGWAAYDALIAQIKMETDIAHPPFCHRSRASRSVFSS